MAAESTRSEGFVAFFRRYTKTWVHNVAAAGLTAFGMLTFVDRWFAALAVCSYVIPPVVLYLRNGRTAGGDAEGAGESRPATEDGRGAAPDDVPTAAGGSPTADARESTASDPPETAPDAVEESRTETNPSRPTGQERTAEPAAAADRTSIPDRATAADATSSADATPAPECSSTAEDGPDGGGGSDGDERPTEVRWSTVDSPTDETLCDAAVVGERAYAVGGGGVVLADGGEGWSVLLEDGPAADGNDLVGIDATDDGSALWVAGDSGTVGRIDTDGHRHTDRSAPAGRTDNLSGVAVGGPSGDETVLLANGSGEVIRGRYRAGDLTWDEPVKPGSGSSLVGIDLVDAAVGYCCDSNDCVFETDDGGSAFEAVGLEDPGGTLTDLAATAAGDCLASADDGVVHRYDGSTWTPERVDETALSAIDRTPDRVTTVDESGGIHERADAAADWERRSSGTDESLYGVATAGDRAVAVGDSGAVVERRSG